MARRGVQGLEVEGRHLELSNLDKVLYPETGFTKGDVIGYYIRAAPWLLGHLEGRPLSLKRYPEGVDAPFFYQKECPAHRPKWFRTAAVWSTTRNEAIQYCMAGDLPALVWLANLGDLELHTFLALADHLERPTMMVFDLDPGPGAGIPECAAVALDVRDTLRGLGLRSWVKSSGSKGVHVHVPLNTEEVTYDGTKPFARAVAETLEKAEPDRVTSNMRKSGRAGRVFVDWSQNDRHKTTVCPYSLRAKPEPTVACPLDWAEVEDAALGDTDLRFSPAETLERLERTGDLFEPVLTLRQRLP